MGSHKFRSKRTRMMRSLTLANPPESVYGIIVKEMGHSSFLVDCSDSVRRRCVLRGKLQKRVWMGVSDMVLVVVKEDDIEQGYIDLKYTAEEVKILKDNLHIKDVVDTGSEMNIEFENL